MTLPTHRVLPPLAALAAAALVAACTSLTTGGRTVQIQRTTHGVAHIEAPDYESLAYGIAYAHAQDNVCQTADHLVTIRGERSRFFGPTQGLLGLRPLPNVEADTFIRAHMDDDALAAANAKASPEVKAMAAGYVAGYNRFLRDNAERLPAPCKGQPWVRPMTLGDYHRIHELLGVQLGIGLFPGAIAGAQPPGTAPKAEAAPGGSMNVATEAIDAGGFDLSALGSNGWAFGADATANGRGMVLGNPHFPWFGANRFWQVHATIPGTLDVMGVAIGSAPLVVIGFNKDVAWTHTVSTGRRFTLFELTLVPGDPTSYVVDGKPEKMRAKVVKFEVRGADGQVTTRETTLWSSRWGPLFVLPRAGLEWTATHAYSLKEATSLDSRFADTWLGIDRARNVGEIRAALSNLGAQFVNTLAADRHGDALYADYSIVPDVDAAQLQRCAPGKPAAALFASAGIVVLNGSRSDCDWNHDPASPVPGLTPPSRMPSLVRRDWVQNSNDSFWLSNPRAMLTGFSPLIGGVDAAQGLRTRAGVAVIDTRLAAKKLSLADPPAMILANRSYAASLVLDDLLAMCAGVLSTASREGCAALRQWDGMDNLDSRGAHVFRAWWDQARNIPGLWRTPFDRAAPLVTPRGLNTADPAVRTKIFEAMDKAVATFKTAGFALDAPLSAVQGRAVHGQRVAIPGGANAEGVLNVIEDAPGQPIRDGYVPVFGTSYLQAVTFDDRGPIADALLTYGQSSQPDSPNAFDQLQLLATRAPQRLPFHPDDVAKARVGEVFRLEIR